MKNRKISFYKIIEGILLFLAVVMMWRGTWYLIDEIDKTYFAEEHIFTALGGLLIGLLIFYIYKKDLNT